MNTIFPRFEQVRLLVIGDIMLDRYFSGSASRLSPEAPVPVVRVSECKDQPGGAGNVALNSATLGVKTSLLSTSGDDEAANILGTTLEAAGVRCHLVRDSSCPTTIKLRVLSQNQQLVRLDFEETATQGSEQLVRELENHIDKIDVLVLSDYGKGTLSDNPQQLIAMARDRGIPVLVDPKGQDFDKYRGCTVITPNMTEFQAVVGPCPDEKTLLEKGEALRLRLECTALLITRGSQGMTLLQEGKEVLHFPAQAREVVDVTGAGDTVIATLASSLGAGTTLEQAADLANMAAGRVVTKLGSASVSLPEMQKLLANRRAVQCGVMTRDQLLTATTTARLRGERIVFTNGCFDILHAGHVGYLAAARARGDRLIVAVNDDASVRRLKGAGRPINSLERRMAVLSALEMVDWVVPFDEDTPEALLHLIKPDMLVKGGDYRLEDVIGASFVRSYGGEAAVLAPLPDCSTTRMVHKIRETAKAE
ncbi:MAG: bifunctional D-glycero-beta-D-manno-heptose-7-phosphate kinase/D-glycero-beta-D-manno-heptose 1-phosphate adenylyltransferase HldE [Kistimonas sp.]|nr:bifunctional D-glycero-beta-D-manno-heptose-7-phosphate kinase/D-glycero-beta-D-manno-heptose 1-phosphate adenylyltransferase HldE [Kistimonas sp.]